MSKPLRIPFPDPPKDTPSSLTLTSAASPSWPPRHATMATMRPYDQGMLPATVQVPAGHKVAMETVGAGSITYECRAKPNMASEYEWFFVGPDARLMDRGGKQVGRYYGPPATWENMDGSKLTATQVAVSPAEGASAAAGEANLDGMEPMTGDDIQRGPRRCVRPQRRGPATRRAPGGAVPGDNLYRRCKRIGTPGALRQPATRRNSLGFVRG